MKPDIYITASEIGEYVYCKRSWWLKTQGLIPTTEAMREGQRQHETLSQWLTLHKRNVFTVIFLITTSLLLALFSLYLLWTR